MPRAIPVRQVMTTDVLTFRPDVGVEEAARRLVERGVDGAPVVDEAGRLLGLVEDDDLIIQEVRLHFPTTVSFLGGLLQLPSERHQLEDDLRKAVGATVGDVMDREPVTVGPDDTLETAATLLHDRHLSRLPVVDGDGMLVGLVARGDVLRAIVRDDRAGA
jgi:CBS domain-containing protein